MTNNQGLIPSFEYVLPAIRGIQAGREYYVSMCPVRFIPKLFAREDEENPPDQRVARSLNSKRVPDIANYILNNPDNYTVSAITAAIDADINFEPIGTEKEGRKMGRLRVPMDWMRDFRLPMDNIAARRLSGHLSRIRRWGMRRWRLF